MKVVVIIPARYASTRFPGKPLVKIQDKPMVAHVVEKGLQVTPYVYVATDDERIAQAVNENGGNAIMTSSEHRSGTDRCFEAYQKIVKATNQDFDVIVNVQGDEPFIVPEQIKELVATFTDSSVDIATLAKQITQQEELFDPNKVKILFNPIVGAVYFSRWPIPYCRGEEKQTWLERGNYFKHIGMYAYRPTILEQITKLSPSYAEKMESLEQLRWLENGYKIAVRTTTHESIGIDTPEDLKRINEILNN